MKHLLSKTRPRSYQQRIYDQFADQNVVMFAIGMGGGKTKILIDIHNYRNFTKAIVVCLPKLKNVWAEEFEKHSYTKYNMYSLEGTPKKKIEVLEKFYQDSNPSILLVSYNTIWRSPYIELILKYIKQVQSITLDESHKIKNPGSNANKACVLLGKSISNRYGLSGTVISERYDDAFGQFKFLDSNIFGKNKSKFRDRYCNMGGYENYQIMGYKNLDEFSEKIKPYWAFVSQDEVSKDLPEITDLTRKTTLPKAVTKLYNKMLKDGILKNEQGQVIVTKNILDRYIRLRDIINGCIKWKNDDTKEEYEDTLHTEKHELLHELFDEIDENEPLVIFANSNNDIKAIKEVCELNKKSYSELTGSVNQLEDWKLGKTTVLIANIKAGGTGISLVRSRYNIYFSLPYSLTDYLQSVKRTHRSGQTQKVFNIHLLVSDTIDEDIYYALQNKLELVEFIKGKLENASV